MEWEFFGRLSAGESGAIASQFNSQNVIAPHIVSGNTTLIWGKFVVRTLVFFSGALKCLLRTQFYDGLINRR
jgi:hypothetical protein